MSIMHRDLKCANILLDSVGTVKIGRRDRERKRETERDSDAEKQRQRERRRVQFSAFCVLSFSLVSSSYSIYIYLSLLFSRLWCLAAAASHNWAEEEDRERG